MPNNTIINLSKIKKNELGIYVFMSFVVIAIIYIPKQKKLLNLFNDFTPFPSRIIKEKHTNPLSRPRSRNRPPAHSCFD